MQPVNFQSTIFSFTCANIRRGSIGKVGKRVVTEKGGGVQTIWDQGIGLLTVSSQQDVGQMERRCTMQCGLISSPDPSLGRLGAEWKWNIAHYGGILLKLWSLVSKYVGVLLMLCDASPCRAGLVSALPCFALAKIILMRFNDFIVLVVLIMLNANADAVPVGCFI